MPTDSTTANSRLLLDVHVVTPERELWSGLANMIVVRALDGEIGVLPGHIPLLAALDIGRVRIETSGDGVADVVAVVDGGFVAVRREGHLTRVDVLAEYATLEYELTQEETDALEAEAEQLALAGDFDAARAVSAKAAVRRQLTQRG